MRDAGERPRSSGWGDTGCVLGGTAAPAARLQLQGLGLTSPLCLLSPLLGSAAGPFHPAGPSQRQDEDAEGVGKNQLNPPRSVCLHARVLSQALPILVSLQGSEAEGINNLPACYNNHPALSAVTMN